MEFEKYYLLKNELIEIQKNQDCWNKSTAIRCCEILDKIYDCINPEYSKYAYLTHAIYTNFSTCKNWKAKNLNETFKISFYKAINSSIRELENISEDDLIRI